MRLLSISFLFGILCIQQGIQQFPWLLEITQRLGFVVSAANADVLSPSLMVLLLALLLALALLYTLVYEKVYQKVYQAKYRLLIGCVTGFLYALWVSTNLLDSQLASELEGKNLMVSGTVSSIPYQREDGWRFRLNISKASLLDDPNQQIPVSGVVRVGWYRTKQVIRAGEHWQMVVRLKRPSGFMNPGGFDYEKWLFQERIIATGYVRKSPENKRISKPPFYSINSLREKILHGIKQRIDKPEIAGIISALAVADRSNITDQQWNILRQTGTNHLIAISGLHIGLVAGFGFFPVMLIWWFFPNLYLKLPIRVAGGIMGAALAIIYALLAGFTLPTQRALIMVLVVLFGVLSKKQYNSFTILATALLIVLLFDPLAVLSQGFWLSFVAVGLIMFTLARRIARPRLGADLLTIQFALSLGMLPLTLALFGTGSLSSPIANLIAIPWVSLVVVPLTLLGVLMLPFATLSGFLLNLAGTSVDYMMQGLSLLSSSETMISIPAIPNYLLLIAFAGFLWLWLPAKFPARWLGLILILPLITYRPEPVAHGAFDYHLLDVGQGLASVVQTKNHVLIYDTGPRASSSFDTGKLVVLPFLRAKNIKHVDTMLVSHEDMDHRGGSVVINENITIDTIMSSDTSILPNVKHCDVGLKWVWDDVTFEILHPEQSWEGNDNDRSCVLRVSNQNHSLLLTGDIQKLAEKQLLDSRATLKSEVMLVPHHGSNTSSTTDFIKAVEPELALAATGYRNRFHFPSSKVVKRYEKQSIQMMTTVDHGAISISFPDNSHPYQVESYRESHHAYWNRK